MDAPENERLRGGESRSAISIYLRLVRKTAAVQFLLYRYADLLGRVCTCVDTPIAVGPSRIRYTQRTVSAYMQKYRFGMGAVFALISTDVLEETGREKPIGQRNIPQRTGFRSADTGLDVSA